MTELAPPADLDQFCTDLDEELVRLPAADAPPTRALEAERREDDELLRPRR